jgi:hypothetical protein
MHSKRDARGMQNVLFDRLTIDFSLSKDGSHVVSSFGAERACDPDINKVQWASFSGNGPTSIPFLRAERDGIGMLIDVECNEAWEGRRQNAIYERRGSSTESSLGAPAPLGMAARHGGL